jgi:hypothetical protein
MFKILDMKVVQIYHHLIGKNKLKKYLSNIHLIDHHQTQAIRIQKILIIINKREDKIMKNTLIIIKNNLISNNKKKIIIIKKNKTIIKMRIKK